ncbi:MAG: zinc-dependent alcohol dehydrogenase [Bilifractor sp.]|jgi:threonine dehydrogenase-like Zn-dependent dehydrogenase
MKAIRFASKGVAELCELPKPVCTDDTMIIEVKYTGVTNGTDRNCFMGMTLALGSWPDMGVNYQHAGVVIEVGKNIRNFKVGDHVFAGGVFVGYVHYIAAHEDDIVVKLPDDFPLKQAALLGVCGVGYHANVRANTRPHDKVVVFGAGVIGINAMQGALAHGAEVYICDVDDRRLDMAMKLGAYGAFNTSTKEGKDAVEALGPFSLAFEVTGAHPVEVFLIGPGFSTRPGTVSSAKCLTTGSRVVMVAGRKDVQYNFNEAEMRELTIIHNTHYNATDIKNIIRHVQAGRMSIEGFMTNEFKYSEGVQLFNIIRDNPSELMGTVVNWSDCGDD